MLKHNLFQKVRPAARHLLMGTVVLGLNCGGVLPALAQNAAEQQMFGGSSEPLQGRVDNGTMQLRITRPQPALKPMEPVRGQMPLRSQTSLNLPPATFQLNAEHREHVDLQTPMMSAGVTRAAKILANYDVELIVDRSMSMRKRDCPGYDSRWGWCGKQAESLSFQLEKLSPKGVTVTTFASDYAVYEHLAPFQIDSLFTNSRLQYGTRMAEPLQDRLQRALQRYKNTGKPALIAVITDGVPHPAYEPQLVVNTLIDASKFMKNPNAVRVVFMQVGARDRFGQIFLNDLDNRLVEWGAKYDYVQTASFERLQQVGLAQALADTIGQLQVSENHK